MYIVCEIFFNLYIMSKYSEKLRIIEDYHNCQIEVFTYDMISELVDFFIKSKCEFLEIKRIDYNLKLFLTKDVEYEILYNINNSPDSYNLEFESIEYITEIMDYLIDNNLLNE